MQGRDELGKLVLRRNDLRTLRLLLAMHALHGMVEDASLHVPGVGEEEAQGLEINVEGSRRDLPSPFSLPLIDLLGRDGADHLSTKMRFDRVDRGDTPRITRGLEQ